MPRVAPLLLAVVAAAACLLLLLVAPSAAELTRVEHPPKTEGSLAILAVGDWGRRGQFNQTLVAQQVIKSNNTHGGILNNRTCTWAPFWPIRYTKLKRVTNDDLQASSNTYTQFIWAVYWYF